MKMLSVVVASLCAFGPVLPAAGADVPKKALCALAEIQQCDSDMKCERVTPEDISAPRFLRIELANRIMKGVGPRMRDRTTKISTLEQRGELIFAQGVDDEMGGERQSVGWTLALDLSDGFMQFIATGPGASFLSTGECLFDE